MNTKQNPLTDLAKSYRRRASQNEEIRDLKERLRKGLVRLPGPGCSKLGEDNPGLVQILNSIIRAQKANSVEFSLPKI